MMFSMTPGKRVTWVKPAYWVEVLDFCQGIPKASCLPRGGKKKKAGELNPQISMDALALITIPPPFLEDVLCSGPLRSANLKLQLEDKRWQCGERHNVQESRGSPWGGGG